MRKPSFSFPLAVRAPIEPPAKAAPTNLLPCTGARAGTRKRATRHAPAANP